MNLPSNKRKHACAIAGVVALCCTTIFILAGLGNTDDSKAGIQIETPTVEGGSGTLSLGEYTTMNNYDVPCWVGYGKDFFDDAEPIYTMNIMLLGSAEGKISQGGTRSALGDAYYDSASGDCGENDYAGVACNGNYLLLYISPVFAMDPSTSYGAYFKFFIEDIKEYAGSTNCSGSYSGPSSTSTYISTLAAAGDTRWFQADFNQGDFVGPHWYISGSGKSGYYSYHYHVKTWVCTDSSCATKTEALDDDACFYIYWSDCSL